MTRLGRYFKQKAYVNDWLNGFPERLERIRINVSNSACDMASKDMKKYKQLVAKAQQPAWPS